MDKRRHAEKLISYLRWLVVIPGLAAANCAPVSHLIAMLGVVALYNGVLTYIVVDQLRFSRFGRKAALVCRVLDGILIAYVTATAGSNNTSAHFLYLFLLVGMGYAGIQTRRIVQATAAVLLANAGATAFALMHAPGSRSITDIIVMRSAAILLGCLIAVYVEKAQSREDQAHDRGTHLQAILHCGSKLASFGSVHELAYSVLESTVTESRGAGGELLLVNEESGELECEAFYSADGPGSEDAPSAERLKAYAKWVMSSGREFQVGSGGKNGQEAEVSKDDRPAIAAPLLGQSPDSDNGQKVLGILIIWGYPGENFGDDAMDMLRIFSAIAGAAIVNLKLYTGLKKSFLSTLQSLANGLEARDEYTRGHSDRVMKVACAIAEELDVPAERAELLRNASLLHDIGKIGVPDAILSKAGKLTAEEWETMRRHAIVSESICRPLGLPEEVLFLIKHHHERLDGKGYPSGLSAQELPFLQRILVVADSFDAMRSRRPYRDAMPEADLVAEFNKAAGRTLDPTVVDALRKLLYRRDLDPIYEEHDRMTKGTVIYPVDEEQKAA